MILHRTLAWMASTLVLMLSTLPARAVDAPPRPPTSALGKIRDLAVTVRARRALQEDSVLGALNLGVWVENGVASVWGPVPSDEVGRRAIEKLRTVAGVADIRVDFHHRPRDPDHLLADLTPRPGEALARIDVYKPDSGRVESLPMPRPTPQPAELAVATAPRPPAPAAVRDRETPRLLAPRPVASVRRQPEAEVVRRPRASLADQVDQVRRADPRFRDIPVRLRGTAVEVRRGDADDAATDLANRLRRIPGVTDVLLTDD
ncbi:MAG: BON domain-containing protein [Gemmataceae bacterium]